MLFEPSISPAFELVDQKIVPVLNTAPFGKLRTGILRLRGHAKQVQVWEMKKDTSCYRDDIPADPSHSEYTQSIGRILFDRDPDNIPGRSDWLVLMVAEVGPYENEHINNPTLGLSIRTTGYVAYGLVIKQDPSWGGYYRVGLFDGSRGSSPYFRSAQDQEFYLA
jgi:hypothetical protein